MKKLTEKINNLCGQRWFPLLFVPVAFVFLLFFSITTSPLYVYEGTDSAVFKTMGMVILQGRTPYVDQFDHKGIVLYLINALGQWIIPGRMGIFTLQVVGMSVALFFMFKTARLFTTPSKAALAIFIALFFYTGVIAGGNLEEEWSVYFFSISLYIACQYVLQEKEGSCFSKQMLLMGILFALTFFIRPNDAVAQVGGATVGILLYTLKSKDYRSFFIQTAFFLIGTTLITVPILFYLSRRNALDDMWYAMIVFNSEYAGGIKTLLVSMLTHNKLTLLLVFVTLWTLVFFSKQKNTLWVLIPVCLLQNLLIGTRYYEHYFIVLMPTICILAAVSMDRPRESQIIALTVLLLTPFISDRQIPLQTAQKSKYYLELVFTQKHPLSNKNRTKVYHELKTLIDKIPFEKTDSIWNYNLSGWIIPFFDGLVYNHIVQCNEIIVANSERIKKSDNLNTVNPPYIIARHTDPWTEKDSILLNNYSLIGKSDTNICKIELFARKDLSDDVEE